MAFAELRGKDRFVQPRMVVKYLVQARHYLFACEDAMLIRPIGSSPSGGEREKNVGPFDLFALGCRERCGQWTEHGAC
jgi:hypothetical protein